MIDLKDITQTLKKYDFIENALLFGSYSSGKESYLSDIDIAVYSRKELNLLELGDIISDLEDVTGKKIDLVILNNLYKKNPLLAYNIYINHKILFIGNKKEYENFKFYALKYYMDTKPLYEMTNQQLIQRLNSGTFAEI